MVSSQGLYFEVDFGIQGMNPEFTTFYKCTDVSVYPNFLGMREVKLEKYSVYLPSPGISTPRFGTTKCCQCDPKLDPGATKIIRFFC